MAPALQVDSLPLSHKESPMVNHYLSLTEGNGTLLQYSWLENPVDGVASWAAVHGVARSRTRLSDFTFTFHFHALEKEMATHSSTLAWRIPGTGETGGLPSMGSHRVGHDWSDLAAAAAPAAAATAYQGIMLNGMIFFIWSLQDPSEADTHPIIQMRKVHNWILPKGVSIMFVSMTLTTVHPASYLGL